MNKADYLVIGGSAAGTTAAEVIRGINPKATITIVTDEDHEEYSRVLIPHYIRHKVSREQVFLKKPEWYREKNIELRKGTRVMRLAPSSHKLIASDGEYEYGKLLITIGGQVVPFGAPGVDLGNIFYMRTIDDAEKILKGVHGAKNAVVIGGGFIGLEFAHSFKVNGIENVTVLVMEPFFWKGKLDEDSAKVLANVLENNGVTILTSEQVERFEGEGAVGKIITKSGKTIDADIVGIGIGIKSDLGFLEGSGIGVGRGILTNEYLETNLLDVYAAGDCAEFKDVIFARQHILGNWANATSQGSTVGKTMAGVKTVFETASSYSISFFNGSCSFIGVTDAGFADEIVTRGTVEAGKMTRIFVKTIAGVMRIVGATVINDPIEVSSLTKAIREKIDVSAFKSQLADQNFELKTIVSL